MLKEQRHIIFNRLELELPKKPKSGGPPRIPDRDNSVHGQQLGNQVREIRQKFEAAHQGPESSPDPLLIVRVNSDTEINEASLERMGLKLLDEDAEHRMYLLTSDKLQEFERRINTYSQPKPAKNRNPAYNAEIAPIVEIEEVPLENKLGKRLSELTLDPETKYYFDVELWTDSEVIDQTVQVKQFEKLIEELNGEKTDDYVTHNTALFRIYIPGTELERLLQDSNVKHIDLPPHPSDSSVEASYTPTVQFGEIAAPPDDAPRICIIDTGIAVQHPLLGAAIGNTESFSTKLPDGIDQHGHGTKVAGIALYGDIFSCIKGVNFEPQAYIFGARVLNEHNAFDDERLIEKMFHEAIHFFYREHRCRIFNISIGAQAYSDGKPSPWAQVLDELARELDILIVVSAGNYQIYGMQDNDANEVLNTYPNYLLNGLKAIPNPRILEPATAVNVITVGALAHSASSQRSMTRPRYIAKMLADKDQPSPFTRTGPGISGTIKPDVCEYGGGLVWIPTPTTIASDNEASVLCLNKDWFSNRAFCFDIGTSLAAPRVAHLAAKILRLYPTASANMIRALIANSATMPTGVAEQINAGILTHDDALRICGYGKPNEERAVTSNDTRVTLCAEGVVQVGHFHIYEIPIPKEFRTLNTTRKISISLAFDPPVRRIGRDYMGIKMGFRLFRGLSPNQIAAHFRKVHSSNVEAPDSLSSANCDLVPSSTRREKGTLQKGEFSARRDNQFTNYESNGGNFHLMVYALPEWAKPHIVPQQRYGLAVTIEYDQGVIDLYNLVQQQLQVRERIRIRS